MTAMSFVESRHNEVFL